jgi:hypothetical protein
MNWITWSVHRLQLMVGSVTSVSNGVSTFAVSGDRRDRLRGARKT